MTDNNQSSNKKQQQSASGQTAAAQQKSKQQQQSSKSNNKRRQYKKKNTKQQPNKATTNKGNTIANNNDNNNDNATKLDSKIMGDRSKIKRENGIDRQYPNNDKNNNHKKNKKQQQQQSSGGGAVSNSSSIPTDGVKNITIDDDTIPKNNNNSLSANANTFVPGSSKASESTKPSQHHTSNTKKGGGKQGNDSKKKGGNKKQNVKKQPQGSSVEEVKDNSEKKQQQQHHQGTEHKKKGNKGKQKTPQQSTKNDKKKHKKGKKQDNNQQQQQQHDTEPKVKKVTNNKTQPSIPPNQPQTTNSLSYGAGQSIKVVHIAEKPSIGQAIAKGLTSEGEHLESHGRSLPIHEFTTSKTKFPKAPHATKVLHRITSVAGHVYSVDFTKEYQSWDSVDPAELFYAPIVKKPNKGSVVKHLQECCKGVDFIVLWMDCDREGENINFEVLDCCLHLMAGGSGSGYDRVYRAHFSAINPSDIIKAYNSLGKPDRNQSLSVDARQELDLKVGVAFSRFQTRYFQGRYGDLDSAVLSYGPCQTPTLGFCVARHVEMETFKPEPYWVLDLGIMNSGIMCRAVWDSGRSFNKNKVDALVAKCRDASPQSAAKVVSVVTKEKKQGRPTPLNTVALLKACSKGLGIGPHQALSVAERLYLSGYLSYPRTESTKYPNSFDIVGTLKDQTQDNRWGKYVSDLLSSSSINVGKGGVDMGDHPPITPCRHARAGELTGDMQRVYDLVTRHFISSVSQDAVWTSTTVQLSIDILEEKGNFTIRGKQLASPGFLAIMMHHKYGDDEGQVDDDNEEEKALPDFNEGDQYGLFFSASKKSDKVSVTPSSGKFCTLDVKERTTTPPTYLTESELISRMEKHGIGTDASISTHIENIQKRYYVELIPGRKLKPTRLGLVLAQGYHLIDNSLVLPQIRSDIELECNKIAKGLADRDEVVKKAISIFSAKFNYFVENVNKMDVLFSSSFAQLQDVGKPFTRCGHTRRYLQFITGPPPRLYNKTTETVYPLPIGGEIKQWTGRHCPVKGCNFELLLYNVGNPARTFPLCPNCFNNHNPEFGPQPGDEEVTNTKPGDEEDEAKEKSIRRMAGKNMIRECPHPDKHPLIEEMTVSPDPESDGVLILDPHLGPKWRLVSTRTPTIVYLPKSIDKVTILDKKDEILGCHLMAIEFKAGESPLEGGKTKYNSCFPSDEVLQGLVRVHHGSEQLKASGRGRGGRGGRGRGRGGRGRGRGRGRR